MKDKGGVKDEGGNEVERGIDDRFKIRVVKREKFNDSIIETLEVAGEDNEEEDEDEPLFAFEDFEIYQIAIDFADKVYDVIELFPFSEKFGLADQLRRASVSISLNLAEGYGKYSKKEKKKFYRIARSSALECVPTLTISKRRRFVNITEYKCLRNECFEISRRIAGLIKAIENRKTNE